MKFYGTYNSHSSFIGGTGLEKQNKTRVDSLCIAWRMAGDFLNISARTDRTVKQRVYKVPVYLCPGLWRRSFYCYHNHSDRLHQKPLFYNPLPLHEKKKKRNNRTKIWNDARTLVDELFSDASEQPRLNILLVSDRLNRTGKVLFTRYQSK